MKIKEFERNERELEELEVVTTRKSNCGIRVQVDLRKKGRKDGVKK